MNYTELVDAAQSIAEDELSSTLIATLVRQAEQKIYQTVDLPVMREVYTNAMTASDEVYPTPADMLYIHNFAVVDGTTTHFLLPQDPSFIKEAYPDSSVEGRPRHYAVRDDYAILLGPTPDQAYDVEMLYARYPDSIVDAETTWLGDEFDAALLNGTLVEVARYLQSEEDVIKNYDKLYLQAIGLLKQVADGRLRQDSYRTTGRAARVD